MRRVGSVREGAMPGTQSQVLRSPGTATLAAERAGDEAAIAAVLARPVIFGDRVEVLLPQSRLTALARQALHGPNYSFALLDLKLCAVTSKIGTSPD